MFSPFPKRLRWCPLSVRPLKHAFVIRNFDSGNGGLAFYNFAGTRRGHVLHCLAHVTGQNSYGK